MKSIYFSEEHEMLRAALRRFINEVVKPQGPQWEETGMVPREVLRQMGELGFFGIRHPVSHGGSGLGPLASVVLAEELGRSTFGGFTATVLVHTDMASPHLMHAGSKPQLDRYLPDIISGKTITAIAVTESDAGSDVAAIRTTARREGDHYVLNGSKMFITNGVHGDVYFVAAKTDPRAKGSRGISMFIVEEDTPGFSVSRALKKMGWLCSDTAELVFADCRIPAGNLLGRENQGFYSIMKNFQNERIVLAAMAVSEAATALEITLEYTRTRRAFGSPLFDKQVVRQKLAMLEAKVEAARQLIHHAAWLAESGADCVREVSMSKALCCELTNEVTYACQQFHGGFGYIRECAIERMARDARILTIGGGATEVMLEEVAKRAA